MANKKITDLTNLQTPVANSEFVVVDIQNDETKAITFANLEIATTAGVEARRAANTTISLNEDTALQSRLTTNVTALTTEDTALQARITANSTAFQAEDTALQSRLTTNVSAFTSEDTALQARITANNTLLHSNDFITFTRLNANLDVIQDNVASIISGATSFTGNVTLQTTNDGSTATPILILDRQSSSPAGADYLGRVQFKGKDDGGSNDTYAQISGKIIDASAGSEDGALEIAIRKDGTNTIVSRQKSDKLQLLNGTELTVDGASEFTGEVTMNDDLIVTGNLTVNGTTTTINTTNMDVDDTMIMLANGTTGSPSNDIGILFNRGNQGNAAIFYDESAKTFKFSDTKDPTSNTSLSPVTSSNIDVGILTAATITLNSIDLSSNLTALAAGIAGTAISANAPTGDYGLLDAANSSTDAFGVATAGLTTFDMRAEPAGSLNQQDLGALT